jgi:hypothetical protein
MIAKAGGVRKISFENKTRPFSCNITGRHVMITTEIYDRSREIIYIPGPVNINRFREFTRDSEIVNSSEMVDDGCMTTRLLHLPISEAEVGLRNVTHTHDKISGVASGIRNYIFDFSFGTVE